MHVDVVPLYHYDMTTLKYFFEFNGTTAEDVEWRKFI